MRTNRYKTTMRKVGTEEQTKLAYILIWIVVRFLVSDWQGLIARQPEWERIADAVLYLGFSLVVAAFIVNCHNGVMRLLKLQGAAAASVVGVNLGTLCTFGCWFFITREVSASLGVAEYLFVGSFIPAAVIAGIGADWVRARLIPAVLPQAFQEEANVWPPSPKIPEERLPHP